MCLVMAALVHGLLLSVVIFSFFSKGSGRDALSAEACLLLAVLMKDENQLR